MNNNLKINLLQLVFLVSSLYFAVIFISDGEELLKQVKDFLGDAYFVTPIICFLLIFSSYNFKFWDLLLIILFPIVQGVWSSVLGLHSFILGSTLQQSCGHIGISFLKVVDYRYEIFINHKHTLGVVSSKVTDTMIFELSLVALVATGIMLILWAIKVAN